MVSHILISLYLTSVVSFCFVSHPIMYCLLLLFGALSASGVVYYLVGFSWYLLIFCLVYVGGVYVLFIYISIYNPNPFPNLGAGYTLPVFFFLFFLCFFDSASGVLVGFFESSHYVCSFYEGFGYCMFCLVLLMGFSIVSIVLSDKCSFFR